jgi:hypothetical protein
MALTPRQLDQAIAESLLRVNLHRTGGSWRDEVLSALSAIGQYCPKRHDGKPAAAMADLIGFYREKVREARNSARP